MWQVEHSEICRIESGRLLFQSAWRTNKKFHGEPYGISTDIKSARPDDVELPIYLISLKTDLARRERIAEQFPSYYVHMHIVDAVDGRQLSANDFHSSSVSYYNETGRLMTPSEVGCTLSHMNALKLFIASGKPYALILEDDIIGNDAAIHRIGEIASQLREKDFFVCGGQEGLTRYRFLFGKREIGPDLFRVSSLSRKHLLRACCYVITQTTARKIIERNSKRIMLADYWATYFPSKEFTFYFAKLLKHPLDLSHSHIEKERLAKANPPGLCSFLSRKLNRKVVRNLQSLLAKAMGHERLSASIPSEQTNIETT